MSERRPLRRPQNERVRIEDLVLEEVPAGVYRFPVFQRPYRWKREDVLDLFDSLWRGYPIGVLLCWLRSGPQEVLNFDPMYYNVAARDQVRMVIDGQQRLRSLVGVLSYPETVDYAAKGADFELYFDLKEQVFTHRDAPGKPPDWWLPMNLVADSGRLHTWQRGLSTDDPLYLRSRDLGRLIREHELLIYLVDTADESVVRQLFTRLNNTGRRLTGAEIFNALHRDSSGPIPDLQSLAIQIGDDGFGVLSENTLLQLCLAVGGAVFKRSLDGRLHRNDLDPKLLSQILPALRAALRYYRDEVGIPLAQDIPHVLGLCITAILCARYPDVASSPGAGRERSLLARFLWRGTLTEVLNGRNQEFSASAYGIARDPRSSLSQVLQRLLGLIQNFPVPALPLDRWNSRRGISKVILVALEELGPRDLRSGLSLNAEELRPEGKSLSLYPIFESSAFKDIRKARALGNLLLRNTVTPVSRAYALLKRLPPCTGMPCYTVMRFRLPVRIYWTIQTLS